MTDLPLERKVRLLTGADFWALHEEPELGLRRLVTSDGPAGVRGERWDERDPSANVPSPTALAATWDPERVESIGRLLAGEARRKGVHVLLAPTVNLHRTPFGGRHFECFSEDPELTARIGIAYVKGVQSGGVAATVKHFVANDSETERFTYDADVDERVLRELYLAPFEAIVAEAQPWAIMSAYNRVAGHTMSESPLLQSVLYDEWGWDGLVMTDWFAGRDTVRAGRAALDLCMPGPDGPWGDALVAAVEAGDVDRADVDAKLERLLRLADRVGARAGDAAATAAGTDGLGDARRMDEPPAPDHPDVRAELRAAAAASFVLATNDGTLPLAPGALQRVAVLGANAAVARTLGGGSATVFPPHVVSPLDGIRAALPDAEVVHAPGPATDARTPLAEPDADGAFIRFLAADGTELATERRHAAEFNWLGVIGEDLRTTDVHSVEATLTFRATEAGVHDVGCAGKGTFALEVDGLEAFGDTELQHPGELDPTDVFRNPERTVPVELGKDQQCVVRVRHTTAGERLHIQLTVNVRPPRPDDETAIADAVALAQDADVAIVVVGTTEEVESEGFDRTSLALPGRQDELVQRVAAANPRTVVCVNAGAPVLTPWADDVAATLLTWFGGQELGDALADVLLGVSEPGGRLPTTWPRTEDGLPSPTPADGTLRYAEGLHVGHRSPDADPRFAFGHGLGYTTWEYGEARVEGDAVVVPVTNAGERRGREVVQLYASRDDSAIERPARWLAGFAAVVLDPGEAADVRVPLARHALEHWDGGWQTEPGTFTVHVGRSAADLRVRASVDAA